MRLKKASNGRKRYRKKSKQPVKNSGGSMWRFCFRQWPQFDIVFRSVIESPQFERLELKRRTGTEQTAIGGRDQCSIGLMEMSNPVRNCAIAVQGCDQSDS